MNFHDQVHCEEETLAFHNIRQLMLYCGTISPAGYEIDQKVMRTLEEFSRAMGWKMEHDEQLDCYFPKF